MIGRIASWPVSHHSMFAHAVVEYGIMWLNDEVPQEYIDAEALRKIMIEFIAEFTGRQNLGVNLTPLHQDGIIYPNHILVFLDFMIY